MLKYETLSGETLTGNTAAEIVTQLREGSYMDSHLSDRAYMRAYADRVRQTSEFTTTVPTDNAEDFVAALVQCGELMKAEEKGPTK
jgi:hypothetical protein